MVRPYPPRLPPAGSKSYAGREPQAEHRPFCVYSEHLLHPVELPAVPIAADGEQGGHDDNRGAVEPDPTIRPAVQRVHLDLAAEQRERPHHCPFAAKKAECANLEAGQTVLRVSQHPLQHQPQPGHLKKNEEGGTCADTHTLP